MLSTKDFMSNGKSMPSTRIKHCQKVRFKPLIMFCIIWLESSWRCLEFTCTEKLLHFTFLNFSFPEFFLYDLKIFNEIAWNKKLFGITLYCSSWFFQNYSCAVLSIVKPRERYRVIIRCIRTSNVIHYEKLWFHCIWLNCIHVGYTMVLTWFCVHRCAADSLKNDTKFMRQIRYRALIFDVRI